MTIIEHILGIAAIIWCICVLLSIPGIAACMLSSEISQQEERYRGGRLLDGN